MRIYGLWEKLTSLKFLKGSKTIIVEPSNQTGTSGTINIPDIVDTTQDVILSTQAQTLTNKTIDSDNNTITNIVDADIKSTAAIAYSKLNLTTSITNSDIEDSAAIAHSKLAPIPSGYVLLGNGASTPTATDITGDIDISNTGVASISAGVIVDADINAAAAIARSKVASGTANHVLINDGSGVLSSEAQLDTTRGGTGVNSTATFPTSGTVLTDTNTINLITNKTFQDLTTKLRDDTDNTRYARFSINPSQSTGTEVNVTLPAGGGVVATLAGAENLLDKNIEIASYARFLNQAGAKFREQTGNGTNEITLQAPAALTADYTLTLPPDDGTSGQALTTDGTGVLTWSSVATDALNEQHIKVGNAGTAAAVDTAAVGDILADDTGGLTIKSEVIVNADVSASAAIEGSKIQAASGSNAGVVTTGTQTLAGAKTFTSDLTVNPTGVDANIYMNAPAGKTPIIRFARDSGATLDTTIGSPANFITGSSAVDFGIDVKGGGRKIIFGNNGTNSGEMNSSGAWTLGASGGTQTHRINGIAETTNGVKLKSSGAGSTTLSHYEEGSFSSLSFAGPVGFSTITINVQIGRFVRIGRLFHWQLRLDFTTGTGTGSGGQIVLNGLPYGTTDTLAAFSFIDVSNTSHRTGYANSISQIVFQTAYNSLVASTNYIWGLAGTYYT